MKTFLTLLFTALFSAVAGGADDRAPQPETYDIEVALKTPWNRDFTMLTTIQVGEPFQMTVTHGAIHNTVAGTLQPPKDGKFSLLLTISEKGTKGQRVKSSSPVELELGKPHNVSITVGIMRLYQTTLRKHESRMVTK